MGCQQIVAKLVAELDGDVCESAFVVDEEIQRLASMNLEINKALI